MSTKAMVLFTTS